MRGIKKVLRLRALLGEDLAAIASGAGLARSTVRTSLQRPHPAVRNSRRFRSIGGPGLCAASTGRRSVARGGRTLAGAYGR